MTILTLIEMSICVFILFESIAFIIPFMASEDSSHVIN